MKKIILCCLLIFIITGCSNEKFSKNSIVYNLNIRDTYQEKILIPLSSDAYDIADIYSPFDGEYISLEYRLLYDDLIPFTTTDSVYYNKKIKKFDDMIGVTLSYDFLEKDFLYENYIYQCFENYNLVSADDYFEVSLSGKYYCNKNGFDSTVINVNTDYKVSDANGTKSGEGYTWVIDNNNSSNVDIFYRISRDYDKMPVSYSSRVNNGVSGIIFLLIAILFLFGLFIFVKKYKSTSLDV